MWWYMISALNQESEITLCFGIGEYHWEQMGYWWIIHDKKDESQVLHVNYSVRSIIMGNGAEKVHG